MATTDSDDTFVSASAISTVCPILQNIRRRQETSSTASITSLVLRKDLEGKKRKLFNAEMKYKVEVEVYNQWKLQLQLDEDHLKLREAEIHKGKDRIMEQIESGFSRVSAIEARKRSLNTEIAEKAKEVETVDWQCLLMKTVCKDLGAVAGRMQEISLELSPDMTI